MLDTLDIQLIDRLKDLSPEAKQEAIKLLSEPSNPPFDFEAWLAEADALRMKLQAKLGPGETFGALEALYELREETP
jgi:hypothetical protein